MPFADPARVANHIADILNASKTWGGPIASAIRSPEGISAARIESGMEVLRAIAQNPHHGYFGSIATLVTVNNNSFLPAHDGEPGIPRIVPFAMAAARDGYPASSDQIDAWLTDSVDFPAFSGALDGVAVPHNQADSQGRMSPVACRYSIDNSFFKFTGLSAQIPLVQLSRTMADTGVPENFEPTLVKLSIPKLVKPGDNLVSIVNAFAQAGREDLIQIQTGAVQVRPVPSIVIGQKAGA